jgi:maleate cis-trans isomerase
VVFTQVSRLGRIIIHFNTYTYLMSFEYAPRGFVGVLTPQANTTVEPEFGILLPSGLGLVTARLVSTRPDLESRLMDYFDNLTLSAAQFAEAPLRSLGVACTGSSYLVGCEREDRIFDELRQRKGIHVTSSALAVVDALRTLNAQTIGLVSPYPDNLLKHSVAYWHSRGFNVKTISKVALSGAECSSPQANPIYAVGSDSVIVALNQVQDLSLDAVVLLGTGMPSLQSILQVPKIGGAPVLSCTLALAWRCFSAVEGVELSSDSLLNWIAGTHWRTHLGQSFSALT